MRAFDLPLPSRGSGVLHGLDFGPAARSPDIVFLHANGFNALTYRGILEPLAADYRILALDQRGHGETSLDTAVAGRCDWLDLRDDLLAALEILDVRGAVLSGHSMGGTVSLLAAQAQPDRARSLILFDPVILPNDAARAAPHSPMVEAARRRRAVFPSREAALTSYRGRGAFRGWPEAVLEDYVRAGFRDLPSGEVTLACSPDWEASSYAAHGHDSWSALAHPPRPIRVLKAEIASTCRFDKGDIAPGPDVVIDTIVGASHFLPMERPDLVQGALRAALFA